MKTNIVREMVCDICGEFELCQDGMCLQCRQYANSPDYDDDDEYGIDDDEEWDDVD